MLHQRDHVANYKGQFHNIDFYIVNREASVIVGLPTCIKLKLITPGKELHIADTLSRSYLNKEPPSTVKKEIAEDTVVSINTIITDGPVSNSRIDNIREECARDEEIQLLREYLHNGFPQDNSKLSGNLRQYRALANKLYEQDGLILYNNRIVIPTGMQKDILFRIHEEHLVMDKCKALARSAVF